MMVLHLVLKKKMGHLLALKKIVTQTAERFYRGVVVPMATVSVDVDVDIVANMAVVMSKYRMEAVEEEEEEEDTHEEE